MNETRTDGLFAVPVKINDSKRTSPFISLEKIAIQINQIDKETFND
ncbi:MAG: hypothetical protein GY757_40210 [bacterium]|nr:hypothetical protein [bacterium]